MTGTRILTVGGLVTAAVLATACHPHHYGRHGGGPYSASGGTNYEARQARREARRGLRADCRDGIQSACHELEARRADRRTRRQTGVIE